MNVGVPDLYKKSYLRKNFPFKKFKSLRFHKQTRHIRFAFRAPYSEASFNEDSEILFHGKVKG